MNEFAADAFSQKLGYGPELCSGLIKISIENLGCMVPDRLYSIYHYSHPPLVERLRAIATAETKSKGKSKEIDTSKASVSPAPADEGSKSPALAKNTRSKKTK